jgi:hypothetical protein
MTKKEKNPIVEALGLEHYEHHTESKCKIYPPLILNFIYSLGMAVFFGIFYFANPDSHYGKNAGIGYDIPVNLFCWSTMIEVFPDYEDEAHNV